jgi:hypothetical protein
MTVKLIKQHFVDETPGPLMIVYPDHGDNKASSCSPLDLRRSSSANNTLAAKTALTAPQSTAAGTRSAHCEIRV